MPRLFWKLFAAFWLTTLAILTVSIFASFQLADRATADWIDPREADAMVRQIAESQNRQQVMRWLGDPATFPTGQTIYLIDADIEDISGRDLPVFVQARARHQWAITQQDGRNSRRPRRPFRPVIHTIGDTSYIAIPGPAALPRFGVLSSSALRWTVLALAAVISLLAFGWLSRSLTRPIERIAAATRRLQSGDMSARVGSDAWGQDEIGQLSRQFDRMAGEIEAQAQRREELFRNISHELRAPLARLQIAADLITRKPDAAQVQVDRIVRDIATMDQLTGQVLKLARAQQGSPQREAVVVNELLDELLDQGSVEAGARGVEVSLAPVDPQLVVHADRQQLASALDNVIRNAISVAPPGSTVDVIVNESDGGCQVIVEDRGPGVPDADLERLFEPFYRVDQNRPGSGIGLAITARVVTDLGGSIVASNRDGGGLRMTIFLPTDQAFTGS
ncbi:MAG: HAMP domain-containing histidine kinase [Gammaproteobacteria bacterium]|nr:HAMP domain-containing histidine kinase [Gammaproteobacteria bacterium]